MKEQIKDSGLNFTESLPNSMLRVRLDNDQILSYVSGRIRRFIRILPGGDRVKSEKKVVMIQSKV